MYEQFRDDQCRPLTRLEESSTNDYDDRHRNHHLDRRPRACRSRLCGPPSDDRQRSRPLRRRQGTVDCRRSGSGEVQDRRDRRRRTRSTRGRRCATTTSARPTSSTSRTTRRCISSASEIVGDVSEGFSGHRRSDDPRHDARSHARRVARGPRQGSVGQRARGLRAERQDQSPRLRPSLESGARGRRRRGRRRGQDSTHRASAEARRNADRKALHALGGAPDRRHVDQQARARQPRGGLSSASATHAPRRPCEFCSSASRRARCASATGHRHDRAGIRGARRLHAHRRPRARRVDGGQGRRSAPLRRRRGQDEPLARRRRRRACWSCRSSRSTATR